MRARDIFLSQVGAAYGLLRTHEKLFPAGKPSKNPEYSHILRAVIVFLIAAVDVYVHQRIIEVVKRKLRFDKFISHAVVRKISSGFDKEDAAAKIINLALKERYYEDISQILKEKISDETFQKSKQLEKAFEYMGMADGWKMTKNHFYNKHKRRKTGPKPNLSLILDALVSRRDIIVHQGDFYLSKKYHGKLRDISRTELKRNLQQLIDICLSIHEITEKKHE